MEFFTVLVVTITALASAFICQYCAGARGHSSNAFFWIGFFLPIIGIASAFVVPAATTEARHDG